MTTIYNYAPATGEYLGETQARPDPLEGTPLVPAYATLSAPPRVKAGQVAVWRDDSWTVEADYRGHEYWLADGSQHSITAIGEVLPKDALDAPPPRPRGEQRQAALRLIDAEHARWLELLTGGATVAERDTWKAKEEAARAFIAGTATEGQSAMIAAEAEGAGVTETALAEKIVAKADTFLTLIGIAAGIRAKARAAIVTATADDVPLDQVETRIAAALDTMKSEAATAAAQFQQSPQTEEA